MNICQTLFLAVFFLYSLFGFLIGLRQSKKGNTNEECPYFYLLGAFVMADVVIFGIFWMLVIMATFCIADWLLFPVVLSVFWVVRSGGEVLYWLNEQFAVNHRNKPNKFWFYAYFPNESVWFVLQIYWQCVLVVSLVSSAYFFVKWLS